MLYGILAAFNYIFIEVLSTYTITLVSGVQHSDSIFL